MEMDCYNIGVTLCLPADTDTPGFEVENLSKPKETRLISEAGGLMKPEAVAAALLDDALKDNFFSSVGFESWLVTTLCVGMTPYQHYFHMILQALLLGPLRLITSYYVCTFQNIVMKCKKAKNDTKERLILVNVT